MLVTNYIKMWEEENILYCIFADNLHMDITVAKQCVSDRIAFSKGKSYVCLIDMKGIISLTKEAREYMAVEGASYITASALLVESSLSKMLSNIFLAINKPPVPVKLFTNIEEAKEWLKQYL